MKQLHRLGVWMLIGCLLVALCGCAVSKQGDSGETTKTTASTTASKPKSESKIAYPVTVWVTADSMRVRSGPGVQHESLGGTVKGDKWTALERNGDWLQIQFTSDTLGYISAQHVSFTEPVEETSTDAAPTDVAE